MRRRLKDLAVWVFGPTLFGVLLLVAALSLTLPLCARPVQADPLGAFVARAKAALSEAAR